MHADHMTMTTNGQIMSWPDYFKTNGNVNIKLWDLCETLIFLHFGISCKQTWCKKNYHMHKVSSLKPLNIYIVYAALKYKLLCMCAAQTGFWQVVHGWLSFLSDMPWYWSLLADVLNADDGLEQADHEYHPSVAYQSLVALGDFVREQLICTWLRAWPIPSQAAWESGSVATISAPTLSSEIAWWWQLQWQWHLPCWRKITIGHLIFRLKIVSVVRWLMNGI